MELSAPLHVSLAIPLLNHPRVLVGETGLDVNLWRSYGEDFVRRPLYCGGCTLIE